MPSFDAGEIVEPIHVRLQPYAEFDRDIKEPSDTQIGEFLSGLKQLFSDARDQLGLPAGDTDLADPAQVIEAIEGLDPDKYVVFQGRLAEMHSALCSGHPTKAQILAVPQRRRNLLFAYLQGEVMSPEPAPAAGGPQVAILPVAASR